MAPPTRSMQTRRPVAILENVDEQFLYRWQHVMRALDAVASTYCLPSREPVVQSGGPFWHDLNCQFLTRSATRANELALVAFALLHQWRVRDGPFPTISLRSALVSGNAARRRSTL